jgi:hypothetical protein
MGGNVLMRAAGHLLILALWGTAGLLPATPSRGESALARSRQPRTMAKAMAEARKSFTFRGKPIHPGMVRALMPMLLSDDTEPYVVAVDINMGSGTNRFYEDVTEVEADGRKWQGIEVGDPSDKFSYAFVGQIANGMDILVTHDPISGSMPDIYNLVVVDFQIEKAIASDKYPYSRLVMKSVFQDSCNVGGIVLKGATVTYRYKGAARTVTFKRP